MVVARDRVARVEVGLEADAVDRHPPRLEVADHGVDGLRLRVAPVVGVVVVVAELGAGVGGAGRAERRLDPVVAGALQVRVAARARAAVGERLVHDVPRVDLAAVVRRDLRHVVEHRLAERGARHVLHPARLLRVPREGVPADLLATARRPADDLVALGVVEAVLRRLRRVHLHLVLGRDHVELAVRDGRVRRVGQPAGREGGAEVAAGLGGRGLEGGAGRLGGAHTDAGGDEHGHEGGQGGRPPAVRAAQG